MATTKGTEVNTSNVPTIIGCVLCLKHSVLFVCLIDYNERLSITDDLLLFSPIAKIIKIFDITKFFIWMMYVAHGVYSSVLTARTLIVQYKYRY